MLSYRFVSLSLVIFAPMSDLSTERDGTRSILEDALALPRPGELVFNRECVRTPRRIGTGREVTRRGGGPRFLVDSGARAFLRRAGNERRLN